MFNKSKNKNNQRKRVLFVGIPDMAFICLDGLNMTGANIVGVLGPKKSHPTYNDFKNFALQRNLNFIDYDKLDEPALIKKIKDLKADIAVVCSFNYKVPKVLLEAVKGGFINVHPSLLPNYRGPNPYTAPILNNEEETGVTLHFMDETFDTGDIVSQTKIPILPCETMGTLFNRTNVIALDMLKELLAKHEEGDLQRIKQPQGNFKIAPLMPESELTIDYGKSAQEINALIRALNPFILARTNFRGALVKVLSSIVVEETSASGEIGTIIRIENDKFYIQTGKGLIALTSVQFGSFFAGTSKEFIEILNPQIGERFL